MSPEQAWTLLIVTFGAFLIPLLSRMIHISSAVGEVLYGLLIGPTVLHVVDSSAFLDLLGQLGFILLMFMAGLEIDFNRVLQAGVEVALVVFGCVIAGFIIAFSVMPLVGASLLVALFTASLSLGLPIAVLRETKSADSELGQMVLMCGSVGEFVTLIGMTVLIVTLQAGLGMDLWVKLGKMLAMGAVALLILKLFKLFVWWKPEIFMKLAEGDDPQEIGMRLSMFIMLSFVGLAALFQVKYILGSFIGGAIIAFTFRQSEEVEWRISNVGFGFLVPLFFINVGVNFNPQAITWQAFYHVFPVVLLAVPLVKIVPFLFLTRVGLRLQEAFLASLLLACPLTLMVAIAELGLKANAIDESEHSVLLLCALLLALAFPLFYKVLHRRWSL